LTLKQPAGPISAARLDSPWAKSSPGSSTRAVLKLELARSILLEPLVGAALSYLVGGVSTKSPSAVAARTANPED
jgi:hypothetical protein